MLIVMPLYRKRALRVNFGNVVIEDYRPAPLLWRLINLRVVFEPGSLFLRLHFRQRRRERRLTVVHVPDRAHIQVRLDRITVAYINA